MTKDHRTKDQTYAVDLINRYLSVPDNQRFWQWCEKNIALDATSPFPGPYSTDMTPFVRWVMDEIQSNENNEVVIVCSAQSAKTTTLMVLAICIIVNDPGPMFWVAASKDDVREFAKTRLKPMMESCKALEGELPTDRSKNENVLIQFPSMNLLMRGSNSRSKLQSTPVRWLILDEVRNYAKGALELVMKRVVAWWNSRTIMISCAGDVDDALDTHWKRGTRTMPHFKCPTCKKIQPFRFGRLASALFPTDRKRGGLVYETSNRTKPEGIWNYDRLGRSVRYECEGCGREFKSVEKPKLIAGMVRRDTNRRPKKGVKSFHWNAICIPWIKWESIVFEFVDAEAAMMRGNIIPMKEFVQETLGEPWELRGERVKEYELKRLCGGNQGEPYLMLQCMEGQTAFVATVDVQASKGGHLKYVLRQHMASGDSSRLISYGIVPGFDDLNEIFVDFKASIKGSSVFRVFIDSGYNATAVFKACAQYGWIPMKGSAYKHFNVKGVRKAYRLTKVDPFLGKKGQGRVLLDLIIFADVHYKDQLFLVTLLGKGQRWLLPDDIGDDYLAEMTHDERRSKELPNGEVEYYWHKIGINDYPDCEVMQQVVADASGLSPVLEDFSMHEISKPAA